MRAFGQTAEEQYPWGQVSTNTALLQQNLNAELQKLGFCPIVADGVMRPETCTALVLVRASHGLPPPTRETCPEYGDALPKPPCPAPRTMEITPAGAAQLDWRSVLAVVVIGSFVVYLLTRSR